MSNVRYYLGCNVDKYETIAHFRIERIMDIQLTELPIKPLKQIDGREKGIEIQRPGSHENTAATGYHHDIWRQVLRA